MSSGPAPAMEKLVLLVLRAEGLRAAGHLGPSGVLASCLVALGDRARLALGLSGTAVAVVVFSVAVFSVHKVLPFRTGTAVCHSEEWVNQAVEARPTKTAPC
ncbi:hypothetical protein LCGC14_1957020 [marine sediment metagenome]|uniref:Uncharacterized protein n=1 Tax=marine sediment metagenome TaxID=412755 RepID=A0A0F9G401_9ZZZZ